MGGNDGCHDAVGGVGLLKPKPKPSGLTTLGKVAKELAMVVVAGRETRPSVTHQLVAVVSWTATTTIHPPVFHSCDPSGRRTYTLKEEAFRMLLWAARGITQRRSPQEARTRLFPIELNPIHHQL